MVCKAKDGQFLSVTNVDGVARSGGRGSVTGLMDRSTGGSTARAQARDHGAAQIPASGGHRARVGWRGEGLDQDLMDQEARRVGIGQQPIRQTLKVVGQVHDLKIALVVRQHLDVSFPRRREAE
jgi:hypothetical protein